MELVKAVLKLVIVHGTKLIATDPIQQEKKKGVPLFAHSIFLFFISHLFILRKLYYFESIDRNLF